MDHPLLDLINAKIREAEERGEFDNLPGAGKPLPQLDDPQNALLHRIAKEHGAVPEFVSLSKELAALRAELRETADRDVRREMMTRMSLMEARIEIARKAWAK